MKNNRLLWLLAGPAAFALSVVILSNLFTVKGAQALGVLLWMIVWWSTRPVNMAVTALLPLCVTALFNIVPISSVAAQYTSDCVILLFGAGLMTMPWSKIGLDRRIALKMLSVIGPSVRTQCVVWFFASILMTTMLPNVVVCALFCQLAVSMLHAVGYEDIKTCDSATPILLSICWGSGVGCVATPLGGAQNIISVEAIENFTGKEFMYLDWVLGILPFYILASVLLMALIILIPTKVKTLEGSREFFTEDYKALGKMKRDEKVCLFIFVLASVLAFGRPVLAKYLPGLSPAYGFLILGCLGFVMNTQDKQPMLTWEQASRETLWDLLCLVGGGIAVGTVITESGIIVKILDLLKSFSLDGGFTTIVFFAVVSRILAETADSCTSAAVMTPIALEFAADLGLNPAPYFFIVIMAYSEEFLLPVGHRAIPVGHGLDPNKLLRYGTPIGLITLAFTIVAAYLMMLYWPPFSSIACLM